MNERFLQALNAYHDLAKEKARLREMGGKKASKRASNRRMEELADVEAGIRTAQRLRMREQGQDANAQRRIFDLQEQKVEIMRKLEKELEALDHPEKYLKPEAGSNYVTTDGTRLFSKGQEITEGMLLTDGEWGIKYHLDPSIDPSIREAYLIEEARRTIRGLVDEQILEDELGKERLPETRRHSYGAFKELKDQKESVVGWVAERMMKTFFKRLCIDYDLDIDLIETDVYEDVEHKIDFVIRRKSRARGVDVEARKEKQDMGIQFTLSEHGKTLRHKREQIAHVRETERLKVEDIILVSLPLSAVQERYEEWAKTKRPGGPTELLSEEDRMFIFKSVLRGVIPDPTIEAQWRIVSGGMKEAA